MSLAAGWFESRAGLPASCSESLLPGAALAAAGAELPAAAAELPAARAVLPAARAVLPAAGAELPAAGAELPAALSAAPRSMRRASALAERFPRLPAVARAELRNRVSRLRYHVMLCNLLCREGLRCIKSAVAQLAWLSQVRSSRFRKNRLRILTPLRRCKLRVLKRRGMRPSSVPALHCPAGATSPTSEGLSSHF